nr:hypothetical protein Iba_chr12cCG2980 [Ipomoea batatas]
MDRYAKNYVKRNDRSVVIRASSRVHLSDRNSKRPAPDNAKRRTNSTRECQRPGLLVLSFRGRFLMASANEDFPVFSIAMVQSLCNMAGHSYSHFPGQRLFIPYKKTTRSHANWPRLLGEALDSNNLITSKLPSVHHIRCFLSTLRNYHFTAKSIGCSSKFSQTKFRECRHLLLIPGVVIHSIHITNSTKP